MELYVSCDVETDGPIPGPHSMLSLGAACFVVDRAARSYAKTAEFSCNFEPIEGASGFPDTMRWWATQPEAWAATRVDPVSAEEGVRRFVTWIEGLRDPSGRPGKPVFVGYPASFDFLFVYWYLKRFGGRSPFGHVALDVKTLGFARLGGDFRESVKRNYPRRWFGPGRHTHVALDDALEQGELFCRMLLDDGGSSAAGDL